MIPELAPADAEQRLGLAHRVLLQGDVAAPLVILVHGRAGDSTVMWAFRRTIPPTWNIIAVQAPVPDPIGGFSWWLVDAQMPMEERARAGAAALRHFMDRVASYYGLTPTCWFGLGFSQGGALLSYIAQDAPQIFCGIALLASFVVQRSPVPPHGLGAVPAVFIGHGSADEVVPLTRSEEGARYLKAHGFGVEQHVDAVAHKVGGNTMRALTPWLERLGSHHG